ncbi:MAG: response regulator [Bacteroidota bacterium]
MTTLKKIILVEDDEFDAELTMAELKSIPLANEIVWLETGKEFIDFIETHGVEEIAVAILDLNMPLITGIEALEIIREKNLPKFPIVVLSSSKEHPDIKRCHELEVSAFVTKPVKTEEFRTSVRTLGLFWGLMNKRP